jgi:hypothetical protein
MELLSGTSRRALMPFTVAPFPSASRVQRRRFHHVYFAMTTPRIAANKANIRSVPDKARNRATCAATSMNIKSAAIHQRPCDVWRITVQRGALASTYWRLLIPTAPLSTRRNCAPSSSASISCSLT